MNCVIKYPKKNINFNNYENEKFWLIKLKDSGITPELIFYDDLKEILVTKYVGEKLCFENMPENYQDQLKNIIKILKDYNCRHNDIKNEELTVLNNKIYLIDFGWAFNYDEENPKCFPLCLGKYKKKKKKKNY